jgi:hypothetical protein
MEQHGYIVHQLTLVLISAEKFTIGHQQGALGEPYDIYSDYSALAATSSVVSAATIREDRRQQLELDLTAWKIVSMIY